LREIEGIDGIEEVEMFEELAPNPKLSKHLNIEPLNIELLNAAGN